MTNEIDVLRINDLAAVPTDDLKRELAEAVGVTARTLRRMAVIWRELERRGEDMSALRGGLMGYLPMIAEDRLEPELVVRGAGQATMLKAAMALPLHQQRQIIEKGVPVARLDPETGDIAVENVPIEKLSIYDVRQAFAPDGIRGQGEQVRLIARMRGDRKPATKRGIILSIRLTEPEHRALKELAAREGKQVRTWARDILMGAAEFRET